MGNIQSEKIPEQQARLLLGTMPQPQLAFGVWLERLEITAQTQVAEEQGQHFALSQRD